MFTTLSDRNGFAWRGTVGQARCHNKIQRHKPEAPVKDRQGQLGEAPAPSPEIFTIREFGDACIVNAKNSIDSIVVRYFERGTNHSDKQFDKATNVQP